MMISSMGLPPLRAGEPLETALACTVSLDPPAARYGAPQAVRFSLHFPHPRRPDRVETLVEIPGDRFQQHGRGDGGLALICSWIPGFEYHGPGHVTAGTKSLGAPVTWPALWPGLVIVRCVCVRINWQASALSPPMGLTVAPNPRLPGQRSNLPLYLSNLVHTVYRPGIDRAGPLSFTLRHTGYPVLVSAAGDDGAMQSLRAYTAEEPVLDSIFCPLFRKGLDTDAADRSKETGTAAIAAAHRASSRRLSYFGEGVCHETAASAALGDAERKAQYGEALQAAIGAAELDPDNVHAYVCAALASQGTGDATAAQGFLLTAIGRLLVMERILRDNASGPPVFLTRLVKEIVGTYLTRDFWTALESCSVALGPAFTRGAFPRIHGGEGGSNI